MLGTKIPEPVKRIVHFGSRGYGRLTALLYLVDLATRYLTDRQAEAGARLGVLGTWLLPVLINEVENLRVEDFS